MKTCIKCKEEKDNTLFGKNKNTKNKLSPWCKKCTKLYNKAYQAKYYIENKKEINNRHEEYYKNNKGEIIERHSINYENNKEYKTAYGKEYRRTHKEELNKKLQNKRKNNPQVRLADALRSRHNQILKIQKARKFNSLDEYLGCSIHEFQKYIESLFIDGMTLSNSKSKESKWNLDHIMPLDSFDLSDPLQQAKAFHYTNVMPLWFKDNRDKSDTIFETKYDLENWLNSRGYKLPNTFTYL